MGTTITQPRLNRLEIEKRKKQGKSAGFYYIPSDNKTTKIPEYKFMNSSGNKIINNKHLKF